MRPKTERCTLFAKFPRYHGNVEIVYDRRPHTLTSRMTSCIEVVYIHCYGGIIACMNEKSNITGSYSFKAS